MIITNKHNLPEIFVRAVKNDKYSRGGADYSATDLIRPVRITHLTRRHDAEIEVDVSDLFFALLGKAVHSILEDTQAVNALQEERLHLNILGRSLSGQADLYEGIHFADIEGGRLTDHKSTSVWSAIYGSREEEWTQQTNIYAYLYRAAVGLPVSELGANVIYRDWRSGEAKRQEKYPPPMESIRLALWEEARQREFIESRLAVLIAHEDEPDARLPECTPEEQWARGETWCAKKNGGKKASPGSIKETPEQVAAWIAEQKKPSEYAIEHRPPERKRCEMCRVSRWCSQYEPDSDKEGIGHGEN